MFEQEDRADKILREYVRERMRDFNPPGTPELWERFAKTRLQQRRSFNRAWPAVCRYAAAVAALLLVVTGVSFLAVPEQVRAVGQKIVVVHTVLMEGPSGNIQISVNDAEPPPNMPPPPPEEGPVPLEQVRGEVAFPILLPAFVPGDYELVGHTYREAGPGQGELTTDYCGDGLFLLVRQSNFEAIGAGYSRSVDEGIRVTQIEVRGAAGTLVERDVDGWVSLSWAEGAGWYRISGCMTAEEALRMATSMGEA